MTQPADTVAELQVLLVTHPAPFVVQVESKAEQAASVVTVVMILAQVKSTQADVEVFQ